MLLLFEKHVMRDASFWKPYFDILPQSVTALADRRPPITTRRRRCLAC